MSFSILDSKHRKWQKRKEEYKKLGLKSEIGRDKELTFSNSCQGLSFYRAKNKYEEEKGKKVTIEEFSKVSNLITLDTTSIFDPVLTELMYKWFCPENGNILDPFAGGSVRGILASIHNRNYLGVDLRSEQIEANQKNAEEILPKLNVENFPVWVTADSRNIDKIAKGYEADFVFSCPPYADLEKYSDLEADISNMKYPEFLEAYKDIIKKTCFLLKPDSFACFVVGEVRDSKGRYRGFVSDTIQAFKEAGLDFYNEMILVTPYGSAAIRCRAPFEVSRKITKVHQNVLVFVKGDPKEATKKLGKVEFPEDLTEFLDEKELSEELCEAET